MRTAIKSLLLLCTALLTSLTCASPYFTLGDPTVFGSGCPSGTVSVIQNGNAVSILLQAYSAESSEWDNRDRKSCNIAVPIEVEDNTQIAVQKYDYRGYAYAQGGDEASFSVEYFFAGTRGPVVKRDFTKHDADFTLTDTVVSAAYSKCGPRSEILRVNTSIMAKGNEAMIQVDSIDKVNQDFTFIFVEKGC